VRSQPVLHQPLAAELVRRLTEVGEVQRTIGLSRSHGHGGRQPRQPSGRSEERRRERVVCLEPGGDDHVGGVPREERGAVEQDEVLRVALRSIRDESLAGDGEELDRHAPSVGYRVGLRGGAAVREADPGLEGHLASGEDADLVRGVELVGYPEERGHASVVLCVNVAASVRGKVWPFCDDAASRVDDALDVRGRHGRGHVRLDHGAGLASLILPWAARVRTYRSTAANTGPARQRPGRRPFYCAGDGVNLTGGRARAVGEAGSPGYGRPFPSVRGYAIEDVLGEGGMGVVYRARELETKQAVALKMLKRTDPTGIYRLKREFRTLADVVHPNLVRLHELRCEDSVWYFTMDLIAGRSFHQFLKFDRWSAVPPPSGVTETIDVISETSGPRAARRPHSLDETRVRRCFVQLARGVAAIHQ